MGIFVRKAIRLDESKEIDVAALKRAPVMLHNNPRFENRNWTLTLPGFEPIYPFDLGILFNGIEIRRSAPFDPDNPTWPLWEIPLPTLLTHGARGMEYEPETVGRATGIWDSLLVATERKRILEQDLAGEQDPVKKAALKGRISELDIGISNRNDRRIMARLFVERFGFSMRGRDAQVRDGSKALLGTLDKEKDWSINFWMGGWDPDLLCAYMEGSLHIPYL
jgi:hypothetical protein